MEGNKNINLKTVEEWEKIFKKGHTLWTKEQMFNYNRFETVYEDFFKLNSNQNYKISAIKIYYYENNYVKGISFTYQNLSDKSFVVEGNEMLKVKKNSKLKSVYFELDDDEYIIEVFGNRYNSFHWIGFKTNKNRSIRTPETNVGNGGTYFSIPAPQNKHFTIFSGSVGDNENSLSNLGCEVEPLPEPIIKHYNYEFLKSKIILNSILDFLPQREIMRLFLVNKELSKYRFNRYTIGNLWFKFIYSCNNQLRNYTKEMIKLLNESDLKEQSVFLDLISVTKNKIKNPYGNKGFEGWERNSDWTTSKSCVQGSRKSAFACSYHHDSTLYIKKPLKDLFSKEEIEKFNEGLCFLVFGTNICAPSDKVDAKFQVTIERDSEKVFAKEIFMDNTELGKSFKHLTIKLDSGKLLLDDVLNFVLVGNDLKFWAGYFGPTFSGSYIRLIPKNKKFEKFYCETPSK